MLKHPDDLRKSIATRLTKQWADAVVTGQGWPHRMSVGPLDAKAAAADLDGFVTAVTRLTHAAHTWGCPPPEHAVKIVARTRQSVPTHLVVPDLATAARVAGGSWPATITDAYRHADILRLHDYPPADAAAVLKWTRGWVDTDVELLRAAADWFATNGDGTGLTPRQVPVPGMHAKWLDSRRRVVALLARLADLNLSQRPTTIAMTYVDPDYLTTAGRVHDSITGEDPHTPPYPVHTVVICENKDTALLFHPHPHTVVIQGNGDAVDRIQRIPWIDDVPLIVYWGDIDQRGLHILDRVRAALQRPDRPVRSILMDTATRNTYERFGTRTNPDGTPITWTTRQPPRHLTPDEQAVHDLLADHTYTGNLRYEQERIPLHEASTRLRAIAG